MSNYQVTTFDTSEFIADIAVIAVDLEDTSTYNNWKIYFEKLSITNISYTYAIIRTDECLYLDLRVIDTTI